VHASGEKKEREEREDEEEGEEEGDEEVGGWRLAPYLVSCCEAPRGFRNDRYLLRDGQLFDPIGKGKKL